MHERDGVAFLAERAVQVASGAAAPVDLIFLDVFDGDDQIPQAFTEPGQQLISPFSCVKLCFVLLLVVQR